MTQSFYITGGTLPRNANSYVPRRADHDLYEGLTRCEFCYVLTSRQMGKSSLMVRTAARLREEGTAVVVLDLTKFGSNLSAEQWYYSLLRQLGQDLDLEDEARDYWRGHMDSGPMNRLMGALTEVVLPAVINNAADTARLIVFVDEIDAVRSLPFSTDEFFAGIRECYNRRTEEPDLQRLTFCLLGLATPSDLIRDTRTTPFNIGRRIELNDFTEEEARPLAFGLGDGETGKRGTVRTFQSDAESQQHRFSDSPVPGLLLQRILYWTGGHPYLTQRLCQAVAEDATARGSYYVDRICEALFLSTRARERDDNLLFVRERLLRSEADLASVLDLYARVRACRRVKDDETNPLHSLLHLSGVTRVVEGYMWIRNRIYWRVFDRDWVAANMPDAEVRRQKAAYRRGLLRASTVATTIVLLTSGLAGWAMSERIQADLARGELRERNVSLQSTNNRLRETIIALKRAERIIDRRNEGLAAAVRVASNEAIRAGRAEKAEKQQRLLVQASLAREGHERRRVDEQRSIAEAQTRLSRQRLARLYVGKGNELTDAGDLSSSLPWLVRALEVDTPDRARQNMHRLRIGAVLRQIPRLQQVFFHGNTVTHVEFSPDGSRLVTASDDHKARLWDVRSGRSNTPPLEHSNVVTYANFSPDGQRVVTTSSDNTARVWDALSGEAVCPPLEHNGAVIHAAFSFDGLRIVTARPNTSAK